MQTLETKIKKIMHKLIGLFFFILIANERGMLLIQHMKFHKHL